MQQTLRYQFKNQTSELRRLEPILTELQKNFQLQDQVIFDLNLSLEEVLTNTMHYGYPDKKEHSIEVIFTIEEGQLQVVIEDDGVAFNPLDAKDPDLKSDIFTRPVGGLGTFLIKKLMSEIHYQRAENRNILSLQMSIPAAA
jgi:anti-sigma regulatory factor (Ser/Thr protein kinase)